MLRVIFRLYEENINTSGVCYTAAFAYDVLRNICESKTSETFGAHSRFAGSAAVPGEMLTLNDYKDQSG